MPTGDSIVLEVIEQEAAPRGGEDDEGFQGQLIRPVGVQMTVFWEGAGRRFSILVGQESRPSLLLRIC